MTCSNVVAQAPLNPMGDNHIVRIDSLTQQLLGNIPSHSPINHGEQRYRNGREFEEMMLQIGSTIPFQYHRLVEQHIRYYLGYGDGYFNQIHERMKLYFPIFEEILDKNGLPTELKYISVIESNLNLVPFHGAAQRAFGSLCLTQENSWVCALVTPATIAKAL